jgi:hypothetical protein
MMKKVLIMLLLVTTGALAQDRIEKNLGDFTELKTYRGLQVEMIKSDSPKLIIEGNKASSVTVKNANGVLKLSLKIENSFSSDEVMVYLHYSDPISVIDGNEGSNIFSDELIKQERVVVRAQEGARIKLQLDVKNVEVVTSTGGYISLSGKSESQDVKANTGGIYKGAMLKTEHTTINAATGGNAEIFASKSVDAKASTAGIIDIEGDPEQVSRKESTGGNIND